MKKTFYITTPIYYPSGDPHIGNAYTTILCDTMARLKRLQGYDVMFLTGTDDHGSKIEARAREAGMAPQAFVDEIDVKFKKLWKRMDISYDRYVRTTDEYHVKSVQQIFQALYDKGEIYKSVYKGLYCKPCESFWTESQLVDGKCPDCNRAVEAAEEEAYFFRLSNYTDKIIKLYEDNPEFLQPQTRVNEMLGNFLKPGLDDLCVSRSTFTWGVPVPFDPGHVVYVWIDALPNYITALGHGNGHYDDMRFWPADYHIMAKEIVRFHAIIWPAILMALDLPVPKRVYAHGWLVVDGEKMSKSRGNVIDPIFLCDRYGVDAVRYFLQRDIAIGQDGNFTYKAFITRVNSDLANDLGNLVSRTVAMAERYFGGTLPQIRRAGDFDDELIGMARPLVQKVGELMDEMQIPAANTEIFRFISRANKYIDETAPWILAKNEEDRPRLASVLYNLLEAIRIAAVLLSPILPETAPKIFAQIGADAQLQTWESAKSWGLLPQDVTVKKGEPLFPRIDLEKELAELEEIKQRSKAENLPEPVKQTETVKEKSENTATLLDIADFAKVELKVAEIISCEPVPKSDKLLLIKADDGMGGRQIVSGIADYYKPGDLTGRKIIIVANLKPAKLRGVLSEGMLLAADAGDSVKVIFADGEIPNGAKVR
ncbi:MAG: methionine--tRNA ligase [Oscillospiraceae bacterium]|nr:methionine--tRNA ligase [Oscillospiraceae bacterium]